MVKRKRAKGTAAEKKKVNDKNKGTKPSNLAETTGDNADVSSSQRSVDDSSSGAKKAKLDSCQSPSSEKPKKYIPPFTASQRVSARLRRRRINSEKSEEKQSCGTEKDVCLERENFFETEQAKANLPDKNRKEVSRESNENKTGEKLPETSADAAQQNDVEMKIVVVEEKDSKTGIESADENALDTAQNVTNGEAQNLESSINKSADENSATVKEIKEKNCQEVQEVRNVSGEMKDPGHQIELNRECTEEARVEENGQEVQEVRNVSGEMKNPDHQIELNRKCTEEARVEENLSGRKREESVAEELERNRVSVDTQIKAVVGLAGDHVQKDINISGEGESDVHVRIDKVEAQTDHFDARVNDVGEKITSVPFLADVCKGDKHARDYEEEAKESEYSQNNMEEKTKSEPKMTKMYKERNDANKMDNSQQSLAEEKNVKEKIVMPELSQHVIENLHVSKVTTVCEEINTISLSHIPVLSSNEMDGMKAQKNFKPVQNESTNKPKAFSSQESIEDKLSEMLAIVTESNSQPPCLIKHKNNTNSSPMTENNEKSSCDPVHSITVSEAEIISTASEGDKYTPDRQEKFLKESVVSNAGFVSDGNNSEDVAEGETSEMVTSVDGAGLSAMVEQLKEVSHVQQCSDKTSQNAATTETIQMQPGQCETMSVESKREQVNIEKVENVRNSEKSDKNSPNTPTTEAEGNLPSSGNSETMRDNVGNIVQEKIDVLVASDKVVHDTDQEVHENDQEVPGASKIAQKIENNTEPCSHSWLKSSLQTSTENLEADISHDTSKTLETTEKAMDVITSGSIDEQSYAEEFRALEELLPADDMGLFDDVLMSQPKSASLDNELPCGDSTIEFLINELESLHCMVASYERAARDVKRQYNSNAKF